MECVCLTCQRSQKFDISWYSACLCIVVPIGGTHASGALSAFVRVSWQQKTYCHVLFVILCHVGIFFLSNKQFSSSSSRYLNLQFRKWNLLPPRKWSILVHSHYPNHSWFITDYNFNEILCVRGILFLYSSAFVCKTSDIFLQTQWTSELFIRQKYNNSTSDGLSSNHNKTWWDIAPSRPDSHKLLW